jgi:hypothetical protein
MEILMALLGIFDCSMSEPIEPVAAGALSGTARTAGGTESGVGELRPKRARIAGAGK